MQREEQAILTKKKILATATELFLTKGYDQATMQDIMDATGLSKGALYHHFKSKQEILEYYTNQEQEIVTDYLKELVKNEELTAKQKIGNIIDYLADDHSLPQLTKARWAEKVPFALLHTLRNTLNVLADYIAEILRQGNVQHEFNCAYPKEIAGALMLLIDIWLDPVIVNGDYAEMCRKVDFIMLLLEKFETPIISKEKGEEIKERLKCYYA